MKRLIDIFPTWATGGGIFAAMTNAPWEFSGVDLDTMFFCEYGEKPAAPLITKLVADTATQEQTETIARLLLLRFRTNWERKFALLSAEYNPLENYSMTEHETVGREEVSGHDRQNTAANSDTLYGFNSQSAVPSQDSSGTDTEHAEGNRSEDTERELTRAGNIGVTTSQQMMESEITLWEWNFISSVFSDVAKLITIPIYSI